MSLSWMSLSRKSLSRKSRRRIPGLVAVGVLGAGAVVLLAGCTQQPPPGPITFTDSHGRACTAIQAGDEIVLDCDYPPAGRKPGPSKGSIGQAPTDD